jgi:hypothetical protein
MTAQLNLYLLQSSNSENSKVIRQEGLGISTRRLCYPTAVIKAIEELLREKLSTYQNERGHHFIVPYMVH